MSQKNISCLSSYKKTFIRNGLKVFLISAAFLFVGGCQTTRPLGYNPSFETFEVRKITEAGIVNIEVNYKENQMWPDVSFYPPQALEFNAKKLKIGIIGDTGCRLKESNGKNAHQNCSNPNDWPYAQVIESFVKETFDFAIHTGDYHYREQCTDANLCAKYTKSIGYTWAAWWDDFFLPTQPLFKKSPVLLIRGNHEDCLRAYSGWNILSPLNKDFKEQCLAVEPYQWIEMGDIVFINFDDSAYEDRKPMKPADQKAHLDELVGLAKRIDEAQAKGPKEIWFLAHKPVYAYTPSKTEKLKVDAITPNLQQSMEAAGLLSKVDYILSGHIHNQQLVLDNKNLTQIIVGNSGSALDPFGRKIKDEKMISTTELPTHFGYAVFERQGFKKWLMKFKNQEGGLDLTCNVNVKAITCKELKTAPKPTKKVKPKV